MSHEMAHQWFGDLVTQAWWDDTWLAEGIATWMAAKVVDIDLPESERGLAMILARDRIMTVDAKAKRPVRLEMHSRTKTEDVYDGLVYQKGAATLKMVEDCVGEDAFQRGIRRYLLEHSMKNAATADLEKDLEEETGVKVSPVMEEMLNRTGYPVMQFKVEPGKLVVDQEAVGGGGPWTMPVCIRTESVKPKCEMVSGAHTELLVEGLTVETGRRNPQTWVWTNTFGSAYYRSVLGTNMLDAVIDRGYSQLSGPERLSLLVDTRAKIP
jgi:alanyl aminopeptidase